ncbi:uncharacterized protein BYT42DRAFT_560422 [Radiomyces spectabilis]|uniref:uncharacterized protein n=1 Tax=Radiomyces spectabilis TaxID=64574 RepID=UPI00221FF93F|nr:uncharacterized protein BYT42DRAFT_585157 [Radiomyces spectabilis]XP_051426346.1 uncharacterized protein BYT42DRAFT_560422 [Radiomyces spectabilis]KAI8369634.1 hypothetical protein BYT42DRAFT_585157 [Radiomyces spectabilis]KAI8388537.1 hypothetical protein BYT42DRAFT_560422 [Radiomyces spectabilis]
MSTTTPPEQFAAMQAQITYLAAQVTTHRTELDQIRRLLEENQQLRDENAQLKAQLAAATASAPKPTVPISPLTTEAATCPTPTTPTPLGSDESTWATVSKKIRPPRIKRTVRSLAASVRTFKEAEGPGGFQYLYIPRSRRLTRQEARSRLRRLGIDPYRILDITFPARSVVGLLIHNQYRPSVLATLEKHTIKPFLDFDPLDPVHLADPEIKSLPLEEQHLFAETLHHSRCEKAVARLPYHLASPIARSFLDDAIFNEADVSRILSSCRGAPVSPAEEKSSDPDTDMVDAKSERAQARSGTL